MILHAGSDTRMHHTMIFGPVQLPPQPYDVLTFWKHLTTRQLRRFVNVRLSLLMLGTSGIYATPESRAWHEGGTLLSQLEYLSFAPTQRSDDGICWGIGYLVITMKVTSTLAIETGHFAILPIQVTPRFVFPTKERTNVIHWDAVQGWRRPQWVLKWDLVGHGMSLSHFCEITFSLDSLRVWWHPLGYACYGLD